MTASEARPADGHDAGHAGIGEDDVEHAAQGHGCLLLRVRRPHARRRVRRGPDAQVSPARRGGRRALGPAHGVASSATCTGARSVAGRADHRRPEPDERRLDQAVRDVAGHQREDQAADAEPTPAAPARSSGSDLGADGQRERVDQVDAVAAPAEPRASARCRGTGSPRTGRTRGAAGARRPAGRGRGRPAGRSAAGSRPGGRRARPAAASQPATGRTSGPVSPASTQPRRRSRKATVAPTRSPA